MKWYPTSQRSAAAARGVRERRGGCKAAQNKMVVVAALQQHSGTCHRKYDEQWWTQGVFRSESDNTCSCPCGSGNSAIG